MSASFRPIYLGESGKGKSVAKNRLGLAKEIGESPIAILTVRRNIKYFFCVAWRR